MSLSVWAMKKKDNFHKIADSSEYNMFDCLSLISEVAPEKYFLEKGFDYPSLNGASTINSILYDYSDFTLMKSIVDVDELEFIVQILESNKHELEECFNVGSLIEDTIRFLEICIENDYFLNGSW